MVTVGVAPIRVLFAGPRESAAAGIKNALSHQPDMVIVEGAPSTGIDLLVAIQETRPDVLVVGLDDGQLPGVCTHILSEYPHLVILGVRSSHHQATLYRLDLVTMDIPDLSPERVADALRWAVTAAASE